MMTRLKQNDRRHRRQHSTKPGGIQWGEENRRSCRINSVPKVEKCSRHLRLPIYLIMYNLLDSDRFKRESPILILFFSF